MVLTLNLFGKITLKGLILWVKLILNCFCMNLWSLHPALLSLNWTKLDIFFSKQILFLVKRNIFSHSFQNSNYQDQSLSNCLATRSGHPECLFLYFYLFICFSSVSSFCFRSGRTPPTSCVYHHEMSSNGIQRKFLFLHLFTFPGYF